MDSETTSGDQAGTSTPVGADDLLTRVESVEARPLAERAEAYARLHDELAERLESADQDPDAAGAR